MTAKARQQNEASRTAQSSRYKSLFELRQLLRRQRFILENMAEALFPHPKPNNFSAKRVRVLFDATMNSSPIEIV